VKPLAWSHAMFVVAANFLHNEGADLADQH